MLATESDSTAQVALAEWVGAPQCASSWLASPLPFRMAHDREVPGEGKAPR